MFSIMKRPVILGESLMSTVMVPAQTEGQRKTLSVQGYPGQNSLNAVDLSTSENSLNHDEQAQKIIRCGQFLAQMFAKGTFEDDPACH